MSKNTEWIRGLVDAHADYLKRTAYLMTGDQALSEDLVQETFLNLYRSGARFRHEASERTYLYRILMNQVKMHYRKRRWPTCPLEEGRDGSIAFEDRVVRIMDLHQALGQLKWSWRQVIILYYFNELGIDEIAAVLGLGGSAVKMRLKRGRERLHELMTEGEMQHEEVV